MLKELLILSSQVLYKVKHFDDGSLNLKARIAPHGKDDIDKKNQLTADCSKFPPTGLRIVFSIAALFRWSVQNRCQIFIPPILHTRQRHLFQSPKRE